MSSNPITISSLQYIGPVQLATILLESPSDVAIIDVRDSDHVGGNIKSSLWIPTDQLSTKIPELLRTLQNKEKVVFHCMLSQQRGPKAALEYARAKQAKEKKESVGNDKDRRKNDQEILILEGGFESWQATFGEDKRLTDDYVKDLWE